MKLAFATGNIHKLREASEILGEGFELVTPSSLGLDADIPETGKTLRANSLLKAQYIFDHLGCDCFADDTGLEVEILGGAPGVYTARYAGPGGDSAANIAKLLREMASMEMSASQARAYGLNTVHASRRARFCTIVTLFLGGEYYTFEGIMPGRIAIARSGSEGFGYDPVFIPDEIPAWAAPGAAALASVAGTAGDAIALVPNVWRLTCADIPEEAKNVISHRGRALRAMADFLRSLQTAPKRA